MMIKEEPLGSARRDGPTLYHHQGNIGAHSQGNMMDCNVKTVYGELVKTLATEYLGLAFNLPNGSGTIWSIMEQDMKELGSREPFADQVQILEFLSTFFAKELVDSVSGNLQALAKSSLGIEYTLRRPKADIGKAIIEGIREDALAKGSPLGLFFGVTSIFDELEDVDEKIDDRCQDQGATRATHELGRQARETGGGGDGGDEGESSKAPHEGSGGGLGEREADGGKDQQANNARLKVMDESITRWVQVPAYTTPPRNKLGRNTELRVRSKEFSKVLGHRRNLLYDPFHSVAGTYSLYHGTRSSSLPSFAVAGIDPDYTTNEFSRREAFYLTNSVQYAYEFPLHYHPSRDVADPVAVLEFKLKVEVLHGEQPPSDDSAPFAVKWYPGPNEEWKKFCASNMLPRNARIQLGLDATQHGYDIVIGPICKGVNATGDVGVVGMDLPDNVYLTQVAFCTERARAWLEQHLRIVFREKRKRKLNVSTT